MTPRPLSAFALSVQACALLIALPAHAEPGHADRALLLPHAGEPTLLEQRERAQRAVAVALRENGVELREQPVGGGSRKESCTQVACAPALLKQVGADLAVALAVWQGQGGSEVHVTIVDGNGSHFPGRAVVAADGDLAQGARSALIEAQSLRLLGPGPWVAVDGKPSGAAVWIDGRFAGSLPYRAGLAPGDHVLEIRADGHAAKQVDLRVPLEPTATTRVDVTLATRTPIDASTAAAAADSTQPGDAAIADVLPPDEPPRTKPSPWNFVIGGALVAAGGALIIVDPVRAAARDGRCADPECNRVYEFGTRSALELAAGIAMVGAGVTVLIWQPMRLQAEVGPGRALVHTRLAF